MDIEIREQKENKSLKRQEISFAGKSSGKTPSRKELVDALSRKLVAKPELIVIKNIVNPYGVHSFEGSAHVYSDAQVLGKVEPGYILKRGKKEEKGEKKEETKKEEPKKEEQKKE